MTPARVIEGVDGLKQITGQEAGVSEWTDVTQDMIDRFADLTGDRQWIHVDVERGKRESPFGGTIAHGFLTMSLMSRMVHEAVDVRGDFKLRVNYGFNKLRFPSPVPAGSRVRGRISVNAVRDVEGGIEVAWGIIVEIEGREKPAVAAEWVTRMYL
jgi:acyl dehydratase